MSKKRTGSVLVIGIAVVLVIGVLGNLALARKKTLNLRQSSKKRDWSLQAMLWALAARG